MSNRYKKPSEKSLVKKAKRTIIEFIASSFYVDLKTAKKLFRIAFEELEKGKGK